VERFALAFPKVKPAMLTIAQSTAWYRSGVRSRRVHRRAVREASTGSDPLTCMPISEGELVPVCPRRNLAIVSIALLIALLGPSVFGANALRPAETEHSRRADKPLLTLCMVDWNALFSLRHKIASADHAPFTVKCRNGPGGVNVRFHVVVVITLERGRSPLTASTVGTCALVFLNRKVATTPRVQKIARFLIGVPGQSAPTLARPKVELLAHMSDAGPFAIIASLGAKNVGT
jgi:hypothetical protein